MPSFFPPAGNNLTNRIATWWRRLPGPVRRRKLIRGSLFAGCTLWLFSGGWQRTMHWLDVGALNPALSSSVDGPAVVASGQQSIILREDGQKVLEFEAERIVISADHVFATTENVTRGVLYRKGKPYLQLKAEQVRLNQQTRDWEAIGTLQASGPHGLTVQAQHATWDAQKNQLTCPEQVKGTVRGLAFDTRRVLYDVGQNKLKCPEKVRIVGKHGTMEGQNGVIDTRTRRVEFSGSTQITMHLSDPANQPASSPQAAPVAAPSPGPQSPNP